jgi:DNA-binding response OmpR family regulator
MKKILIVEDDKDFLWMLRQSFNDREFSVIYAQDGEEALAMAKKEAPDLMIVDIMMPTMNGIDMAKKAREEGVTAQIIFLTNLHDPEHIGKALEAVGGADYVVKSDVNLNTVVERVKSKLGI